MNHSKYIIIDECILFLNGDEFKKHIENKLIYLIKKFKLI
jgi:hypothetical protein